MAAKALDATSIALPRFELPEVDPAAPPADPFALTSHQRARRALEFGLGIDEPGFNVFVLGESRSGRMTATLDYLKNSVSGKPPSADWIYVANFQKPHRPRPYRLPAGQGRARSSGWRRAPEALAGIGRVCRRKPSTERQHQRADRRRVRRDPALCAGPRPRHPGDLARHDDDDRRPRRAAALGRGSECR